MELSIETEVLLKEVQTIRKNHSRIGTRKLYEMLSPVMMEHQIKSIPPLKHVQKSQINFFDCSHEEDTFMGPTH